MEEEWPDFLEEEEEEEQKQEEVKKAKLPKKRKRKRRAKKRETIYICPECGFESPEPFKYCPRCGAGPLEWPPEAEGEE